MNVRLMALSYKDITVTLMSGKTMVTLLRRILSQTNSIYRNIFVSVFFAVAKKPFISLLWLVTPSVAPSRFAK